MQHVTAAMAEPEPEPEPAAEQPRSSRPLRRGQQRRLAAQARDRARSSGGSAAAAGGGARCAFFIEKKQRYCTQRASAGKQCCGAHEGRLLDGSAQQQSHPAAGTEGGAAAAALSAGDGGPARPRVPCPIDPSHSVFLDQLSRHLKVCTTAKQLLAERSQPYFAADVNSGVLLEEGAAAAAAAEAATRHRPLSLDDAPAFARQVAALYTEHVGALRAAHLHGAAADADADAAGGSSVAERATTKHMAQQTSILANMQRVGILASAQADRDHCPRAVAVDSTPPVYVEFGAGRGLLSLALRELAPTVPLLLVERDPHTRKALRRKQGVAGSRGADDVLRRAEGQAAWGRLQIDIRHLDLRRCGTNTAALFFAANLLLASLSRACLGKSLSLKYETLTHSAVFAGRRSSRLLLGTMAMRQKQHWMGQRCRGVHSQQQLVVVVVVVVAW
jgi:hypothetical protein